MNPLKKGPQIKLPENLRDLKVPDFLSHLYADLRDRHLLPLVIVLAVAIVAVPIVLSDSGGSEEEPATGDPAPSGAAAKGVPAQNIVVSRSTPRLRNYHRRLKHLAAEDPFVQQFTGPSGEGAGGESGAPSSESSSTSPVESGTTVTTEEGETVTHTEEFKYFTYTIDVKVTPVSSKGVPSEAKPTVRHNLPELTAVPSRQIPAMVFMEPTADGKKALMLLNSNVRGVFGEGICVTGGEICQLMALKPGMPETVIYGGSERTYRITLLGVHLEETDKLKKAPLGKPPHKNGRPQTMATAPFGAQPK